MDYSVSPEKLQQLNVQIDVGGHIPSDVSDALANLQPFVQPAGKKFFNDAVQANIRNGESYSNIQAWHDSVKNSGNTGGGTGGGSGDPPSSGAPMDPIPADGKTYKFMPFPKDVKVTSHAGGNGRFSAATPSGNVQWKVWVNQELRINGGMDMVPVQMGDLIEWMQTTQNQDECSYTLSLP